MSLLNFNEKTKDELVQRVIKRINNKYLKKSDDELDDMLEEMIFWEKKRIRRIESSWRQKRKIAYWENYKEQYVTGPTLDRKALLKGSVDFYANQIVGRFSPWVYHLSTTVIPKFLNLLLNTLSFQRVFSFGSSIINEKLLISGNISWIRTLSQKGTLVLVPTHLSNLDSILLGTAIHYSDLPPVMYGAGLNLFQNRLIGFFMNHLGAYKVDRLRVHSLYKDILKEYASSALELGFHNLFFAGGTRSRSGTVEKKLKLGLLGATLSAYIRNLQMKKANPNIYIVPVNINSHLTLEAETLIEDFLKKAGQSRFIIHDDEFSKPNRIYSYMKLDSKNFIHFGEPLDPFGNHVDENGISVDRHGRHIDIKRYVMNKEFIELHEDRDRNYTKELASSLLESFHKNNRVLSTNIVAFTLYEMVANRHPELDIYKLLRSYAYHTPIALKDLYKALEQVMAGLQQLSDSGKLIYGKALRDKDPQDIVNDALRIFASYHTRRTIYRVGDKIHIGDLLLLYYYHNRLIGYNLEDMMRGAL